MSDGHQESRADRIAHYKEERRKQIAAQISSISHSFTKTVRDVTSSSSDGPRPTRASRLRAAVTTQDNNSSRIQGNQGYNGDKVLLSPESNSVSSKNPANRRLDRDKSSKRKSNLNRSLNSEEVPALDYNDDLRNLRRRRRIPLPEALEDGSNSVSDNNDKCRSDSTSTANHQHLTSPATTSPNTTIKTTPRKSQLSVHMENARKGITSAYSEMGKPKSSMKQFTPPRDKSNKFPSNTTNSEKDIGHVKYSNKENIRSKIETDRKTRTDDEAKRHRSNTKKMEELTALTKETLARVERLANRNREAREDSKKPMNMSDKPTSKNSKLQSSNLVSEKISILKKKTVIEQTVEPVMSHVINSLPVSILKRKVSQDEHKSESVTYTPPVTFSPSVIEPTTTNRKQGILKKRRSLDESQVMRHRSCSPDVANKSDSKSILKNQRRSSLEELRRVKSPETHLQGILKRKSSKPDEDNDHSLNSPQSILKRRSGASSAGSTSSTPHVSITTAVILAAARGAEMILNEGNETVKPILKKKSFSDEHPYNESAYPDVPKPILKKKSSTDTDDYDERPMRPILKVSRLSSDREFDNLDRLISGLRSYASNEPECEVKPILKQNNSKDESLRPRLSFCEEGNNITAENIRRHKSSRRSHPEMNGYGSGSGLNDSQEERTTRRPRPLSVSELVTNFEISATSKGAVPKRSSLSRNSDRYKTQPVTSHEFEASLLYVNSPSIEDLPKHSLSSPISDSYTVQSLLDFTSSLEHESNLNVFLSSSLRTSSPDNNSCAKMSSDSAFQSLGDGLELEQDELEQVETTAAMSLKPQASNLELQMKAIAEEAKRTKLHKGNAGVEKYKNRKGDVAAARNEACRFATQPVTLEELQEASRINTGSEESSAKELEPSRLSLSERIKLFSTKISEDNSQKRELPRIRVARFQTQPVTYDEVRTARHIAPASLALDDEASESGNMGKSEGDNFSSKRLSSPDYLRPINKKHESFGGSPDLSRHSLNLSPNAQDITYDEGISCNDSDSDLDHASVVAPACGKKKEEKKRTTGLNRSASARIPSTHFKYGSDSSDGESSGGREVRKIFKRDDQQIKQTLESILSTSRSQNKLGDADATTTTRKNTSIRRSHTHSVMPRSIAELQATLQRKTDSEWKKRHNKSIHDDDLKLLQENNKYNDELSEKTILASRKDELDAASKQWKSRVEKSDADKFSVAGRMDKSKEGHVIPINIPVVDVLKKTPQAKRFKGKESDSSSTPVSPEKNIYIDLKRSQSVPNNDESLFLDNEEPNGKNVSLLKTDDYTFKNFYKSIEVSNVTEKYELTLDDLDFITRQSLLVQKKDIPVQKRRGATKNPIKALALRSDIQTEYTEKLTGVAERETKRLNIEKLAKTSSHLAIEALAGLASKEDFKAVPLKKGTGPTILQPFKDLMLLHVKGRNHVQTRLVNPVAESINEGDNFILITPTALYNYVGTYSNVIEQSRASDIVSHIQQKNDLGCKVSKTITINSKIDTSGSKDVRTFWNLLGSSEENKVTKAGNPSEDDIYVTNILSTNMIYGLENNELVPLEKYWGNIPKIEMLGSTKVFVFDFGSEMYVWSGKKAPADQKQRALKLAKELWNEGYNYTDCGVCPLNVASILGNRVQSQLELKSEKRPDWALFCKITQHRETILFTEKFLDWPDLSRLIRVKEDVNGKSVDPSYDIRPCNVDEMIKYDGSEPDLVLDSSTHLGRGDTFFDNETNRQFDYNTLDVTMWRILENTYEQLNDKSMGQFYNGDSYILRWRFRMIVKGRKLTGLPSKHAQSGRDRAVYFCWQGCNASINEKGSAALLTIELDNENAPQLRVAQGSEHAAFLKLFNGIMIVHNGKRDATTHGLQCRLFIVRGELEDEVSLVEVPCKAKQLRSQTSFVLVDPRENEITVWHGFRSSHQIRKVIRKTVDKLVDKRISELNLEMEMVKVEEVEEGAESDKFLRIIGSTKCDGGLSPKVGTKTDYTLRMFHLSSLYGSFTSTEVLCPHRSCYSSPFPFLQSELYSASQPALFLIVDENKLWLWQGWWPDREEEVELSDQTGSGAVRWQAERRAAMQTCINYWKKKNSTDGPVPAHLVWAGLEPVEFQNLFPYWSDRADVAVLNIKEGKQPGEIRNLEKELVLLSRTTFPLSELLQKPLPEGVDPTHLEIYLSPDDFQEILSMSKNDFQKLPPWKQTALKKEKGLF